MIVRLIKKSRIFNFTLPTKISGNYWITDNDYLGNTRNLINVEEYEGNWKIKSDFETKIMSGDHEVESAILKDYSIYFLKINNENEFVILYCSPTIEEKIIRLKLKGRNEIVIGSDSRSNIVYNFPMISKQHTRLIYNNNQWVVQDLNSKYGTYVNSNAITYYPLEYGDIIFIMGLKIIVMNGYIIVNNVGNYVQFDNNAFDITQPVVQHQTKEDNPDEETIEFYKEDDYFYRAPRFKTRIEPVNIQIDTPPGMQPEDKTPLIYTLGPMLTMAMTSASTGMTALQSVADGTKDMKDVMPTLVISGAMLSTMLLWPLLSKRYQTKERKKQEKIRNDKYTNYIEEKRTEIQNEMKERRQILIDNYLPLESTKEIIYTKK